jgi:hypothetical protein
MFKLRGLSTTSAKGTAMRSKCCLVLAHLKAIYIILIHVAVQPVENRDIEIYKGRLLPPKSSDGPVE